TKVEVPKELPKVSMVNTSLKKLKHHLDGFDVVVKERTTTTAITEALKAELRKLKGKALVDNVVTSHTITPEMLKIDVEPIAPRLLKNRTVHSDYLRLTPEQAATLKEEKGLIIAALKDELRKLKGKALVDNVVTSHTITPEMLKIDVEPIAPRLLKNRTVHSDYLRLTPEQAATLKEVVEQEKS
nr:hypothetical protein [Tanacetum cinerariifolium]